MHVLITGINGYISQYLLKYKPADITVTGTYHKKPTPAQPGLTQFPLDLVKNVPQQLNDVKADVIIHTAAMSNLSQCEQDPALAYRINSQATEELADWCKQRNIRLIYLSTDIVFDGENAPYSEDDKPLPVNVYGKSKYAGEQVVGKYDNNTIARLALVMGMGLGENKNFVDWVIERINKREPVELFFDEIRTPVCAIDVAKILWQIAINKNKGIYHLCTSESIDRLTLGTKICQIYDPDFDNIKAKSFREMNVKRPGDVSLINNNLKFEVPSVLTETERLFIK